MSKRIKDYTFLEEIGEGGFARVYKARNEKGQYFAIKEMKKLDARFEKYIEGELNIIKQKLKHRNITRIFEYFIDKKVYIVMEYCEMGDLDNYLVKNKVDLNQRISFMQDMALGVNYLHTQNIIHRDLKPENVLLTYQSGNITCKISDFGVSKIKLSKYDKFQTYIGSFPYMAPEITGKQEYSNEVDVFALGLLFHAVYKHTVLTNSFGEKALIPGIYNEQNNIAFLNEIMKREEPTIDEFLVNYFKESDEVGKFVFSMIDLEPANRPEMDYVLIQMGEIKAQHQLNPQIEIQEASIRDLQQQNIQLRNEMSLLQGELQQHKREKLEQTDIIKRKDKLITDLQVQCQKQERKEKQDGSSTASDADGKDKRQAPSGAKHVLRDQGKKLDRVLTASPKLQAPSGGRKMTSTQVLKSPVLILDVEKTRPEMKLRSPLLALSDGEVLVVNTGDNKCHVIRLDKRGCVVNRLITTSEGITGLIWMDPDVIILHPQSITRVHLQDGRVVRRYTGIDVRYGIVSGISIDEDNLMVVDSGTSGGSDGCLFTYSLKDQHKKIKINNLNYPLSVIRIREKDKDSDVFVVCESGYGTHTVNIYNSTDFTLLRRITGSDDGPFSLPTCVIELPTEPGTFLVADRNNHRVSMFNTQGTFIRHVLSDQHHIKHPLRLSFDFPYLWLSCIFPSSVKCFEFHS